MLKTLATALALSLPVAATAAETYRCDTTNFGSGGWVPPVIYVFLDREKQTASIFDAAIKSVQEDPLPATLKQFSDTRFQFNWRVKGLKATNGGRSPNTYRMTMFTNRGEFTLSGQRLGYDNVISGAGRCKRES